MKISTEVAGGGAPVDEEGNQKKPIDRRTYEKFVSFS